MCKYLEKAIDKFKEGQLTNLQSGVKYSASYGKWNDSWNIQNVIQIAYKYYLIDKL